MKRAVRGVASASCGVIAAIVGVASAAPAVAAADKLAIAPGPAWVVPVAVPADDGKGADAPVKLLLSDEQDDLQPGHLTRYFETVFKVQTPQGLPSGAVALTWDPDTQVATVHKLQIHRGGQVIDVLASGQTFTVMRRETNLESAVLNGQLTASIQPEGLQIGDVVDFAMSIATSDPAVGNHVEDVSAAWNNVPIGRAHLRAQWPAAIPMRIQANGGLTVPKTVRKAGLSSLELEMDGVQPLVLPKGAPMRYQYGRLIEMTDAPSWSAIVSLLAPLYAKAATLSATSPLQAEIARIKAASPDLKARAAAALALVQDRVRYVFLGMNDGGLVPADADTTWSRRFGDCKGKTALLLALLQALGIDAHPVLVNSAIGDGLDKQLPEVGLFDHVLVQATIGGKGYWLDGTRVGDRAIDGIRTPYFHWGLPLVSGTTALAPIVPPPYDIPQTDVAIRIDASGGLTLPAPLHIERTVRGDEAVATNLALANLIGDARDRALREFWRQRYDFAEPQTVATSFDPDKREMRFTMDGTTKMDWSRGWYEADHVWVGFDADFHREPGPDHDAPYVVGYPDYTHVTETVLLPPNAEPFTLQPESDVDQTVAGIEYHRRARIEGNRFIVEESDRTVAPEFPAADAPAAQVTLRALAKKGVFILKPAHYLGTKADIEASLATSATTASDLLDQGNLLLDIGRYRDAIDRFTRALAIDPKNVFALADRGIAHAHLEEAVAARNDLDAAAALDPRNEVVFNGRGLLALQANRPTDAITAFSTALDIDPKDDFARWNRLRAFNAVGKNDEALADSAIIVAQHPGDANIRLLRANILKRRGDDAGVAREADALAAASPQNSYAQVVAGKIYASIGRQDDAMRALDAALAIKPESYIYINRFEVRPKSDIAGRGADLDAALKLDPNSSDAILTKAAFQRDQHDWKDAVATLAPLIAAHPDNEAARIARATAYAKLGEAAEAQKDFDAASAGAHDAGEHNNVCYDTAVANVLLTQALAECDKALALQPDDAAIGDSRAFVLLRLGRMDEAIAAYDKVLTKAPIPVSYYGRALAEAHKGDQVAADRDIAAALKLDPQIAKRFDDYGMTMPGAAAKPAAAS